MREEPDDVDSGARSGESAPAPGASETGLPAGASAAGVGASATGASDSGAIVGASDGVRPLTSDGEGARAGDFTAEFLGAATGIATLGAGELLGGALPLKSRPGGTIGAEI